MVFASLSRFPSRGMRGLHSLSRRNRHSFSATWQTVDESRSKSESDADADADADETELQTPDPLSYLHGFDAVPQISILKDQITAACHLQGGDHMLDIGCGTGTHMPAYSQKVGSTGSVNGLDKSRDMIDYCRTNYGALPNTSFTVGDVYAPFLPYKSRSFDIIKEDRVLQHLERPLEALQEMHRVLRPGGRMVACNPDFRSFQINTLPPQYRGDARRPPPHLNCDLGALTQRVLNGVIPTLCAHSGLGLSLPTLMQRVGLDVELRIVAVPLIGRRDLETVVPISYMSRLSWKNGGISEQEMEMWLQRLEWEYDEAAGNPMMGVLNFYICRGIKPNDDDAGTTLSLPPIGTKLPNPSPPRSPKKPVSIRFVTPRDTPDFVTECLSLINTEYCHSDTGITLSSPRLRPTDIHHMVHQHQLMVALCKDTHELLGCVQVLIKDPTTTETTETNSKQGGLPNLTIDGKIGEFTCLAVKSNTRATIKHANTQNVTVEISASETNTSKPPQTNRSRGIGAELVRAAESHARHKGCTRMQLGVICPSTAKDSIEAEPEYKVWLQHYYRSLGYEHRSTVELDFELQTDVQGENVVVKDQLHDMYDVLHQLVPCKAILFDKQL